MSELHARVTVTRTLPNYSAIANPFVRAAIVLFLAAVVVALPSWWSITGFLLASAWILLCRRYLVETVEIDGSVALVTMWNGKQHRASASDMGFPRGFVVIRDVFGIPISCRGRLVGFMYPTISEDDLAPVEGVVRRLREGR